MPKRPLQKRVIPRTFSDACRQIAETTSQLSEDLFRYPLEPTALSIDAIDGAYGCKTPPLAMFVSSPEAMTVGDITLQIIQSFYDPFRLIRVSATLQVVCSSLEEISVATEYAIRNMTFEALLEVPGVVGSKIADLTYTLRTAVRDCSTDMHCDHSVLFEIPYPPGIALRPGAAAVLTLSLGGSAVSLRIPAIGHLHSASCNHRRVFTGAMCHAAALGNTVALKASLRTGGSTEEVDNVRMGDVCHAFPDSKPAAFVF